MEVVVTNYTIWKDGKIIDNGGYNQYKEKSVKARLKMLNGNTLHIINGDVIHVYHNKNNRVTFSHTFTREEK